MVFLLPVCPSHLVYQIYQLYIRLCDLSVTHPTLYMVNHKHMLMLEIHVMFASYLAFGVCEKCEWKPGFCLVWFDSMDLAVSSFVQSRTSLVYRDQWKPSETFKRCSWLLTGNFWRPRASLSWCWLGMADAKKKKTVKNNLTFTT